MSDGGGRCGGREVRGPGAPAVALADVTITFRLADGGTYTAVRARLARCRRRRIRRDRRPDRLRQIDAAQCRRRAVPAVAGPGRDLRRGRSPASIASPATCSSPRRCFPGRPRWRMSPSGSRPRARRATRRASARRTGSTRVGLGAFRPALSAHAVRRAAQARRPRAGADPRSENPADGRAVRAARRADAADHGQPAARSVERRPQGGDVRHPRSRGGDRAVRPRGDHVGGAGGAHHRRLAGAAGAPARHRRGQARPGVPSSCTATSGRR